MDDNQNNNNKAAPPVKRKAVNSKDGKPSGKTSGHFPVAGIGASAGGLETFESFFGNMPENPGMAFVVIQHLDPTYKGMLPEILQRTTKMKVVQATDRMTVKKNKVYVIPPNCSMSVYKGMLHLFEPVEPRGQRLPIDLFFRSLAEEYGDRAIGIVLSGMGSDGSLGLSAIKEKGGLVLVQEPGTAKFDSMPRSAIDAVVVDIVAPSNELPARLMDVLSHRPLIKQAVDPELNAKSALEKILILLRAQTGNDFSMYKKNTIYRRVERRMSVHQIIKISNYVRFLQENPKETDILFKELMIGVTKFFRDIEVWDYLKNEVLPELISSLPNGYVIRAWVPACSTGEEAYSLAMVFKEALMSVKPAKRISLQVFATDIDADAIEKARRGIYPQNIESDVSSERIARFFVNVKSGYKINSEIREMVVFALHNIIKDAPFTKLDLISCRNLLIYLEPALQKKLMLIFNYSLMPEGRLILGTAETNSNQNLLFGPVNSKFRVFRHLESGQKPNLMKFQPSTDNGPKKALSTNHVNEKIPPNIQALTEKLILLKFSPSCVLVNINGDIIHISGSTGRFLELPSGKINMNVFAMAKEGLSYELGVGFRKALQGFEPVHLRNLPFDKNDTTTKVDITIQQIDKPAGLKGLVLIAFKDVPVIPDIKALRQRKGKSHDSKIFVHVEDEYLRLKEELLLTQEEKQSSQEELKSANEELQTINEELQSTNEELTTSKEEMQSLNEELQTINADLQSKVDDYARVNNDMNNLLNSTDSANLFLDKHLQIRRFTSKATDIFKLIESDIGRPFTDQVTELVYPELSQDARKVLRTLVFIEKSIKTLDGRWYKIRIMPYRTIDDKIDGLVITFTDISKVKKLEEELKLAKDQLKNSKGN